MHREHNVLMLELCKQVQCLEAEAVAFSKAAAEAKKAAAEAEKAEAEEDFVGLRAAVMLVVEDEIGDSDATPITEACPGVSTRADKQLDDLVEMLGKHTPAPPITPVAAEQPRRRTRSSTDPMIV
jgi:hypothetical protein